MSTATMNLSETLDLFKKYVVPNYVRYPVSLVRGEGSYVWDAEGNRYLDFFPGWGCNLLGHCPPAVVEAVQDQHLAHALARIVGPGIIGAQLRRPGIFL
jgi:acetylornithine/N-succinyldiaminopimelate aminotransferase